MPHLGRRRSKPEPKPKGQIVPCPTLNRVEALTLNEWRRIICRLIAAEGGDAILMLDAGANNISAELLVYPQAKTCRCREPKKHRDCSYCGVGWDDGRICGVCRDEGVAGRLIVGTGRVICKTHKKAKA